MAKNKIIKLGDTGIYLIDDFLTSRECATLRGTATRIGFKNKTFNSDPKKYVDKSHLIFLKNDQNKTIRAINERLYKLTQFSESHSENLTVARYKKGGSYGEHNDYHPSRGAPKNDVAAGRVAQVLIYLNEVEEGGETHFTHLKIKIVPKKGRAVLWFGVKGMTIGDSTLPKSLRYNECALHAPLPVLKGEKWISTKFFHDKPVIRKVKQS